MKEKSKRLECIKEILSSQFISGQDELLSILINKGFDITQATLSRDLKSLKVAKTADESGEYRYVIQAEIKKPHSLESSFLSAEFTGNILVLRTLPGYSNAIAVLIDNQENEMLVGSIAGDDTIFIALNEDYHDREEVLSFIYDVIKS